MPELKIVPEPLKCEYPIEKKEHDQNGKLWVYHEKCNLPASVREIVGTLASAKAILCDKHARAVDAQVFISSNGWPLGRIEKTLKVKGYRQIRLPGTGVK